MSSISFWQADVNISNPALGVIEPLRTSAETDVAIVGGGITGTALALWLSRAGIQVYVLESRSLASGASGRNTGFITSAAYDQYATIISHHGREQARRIWAFHIKNHALATQVIEELATIGWSCEYRRRGSMELAANEQELDALCGSTFLLKEDGWKAELVERNDLPIRMRDRYYGGVYYPEDGEFHPVRFVTGLALLAQQAGAVFHDRSPVTGIQISDDGMLLITPEGVLRARNLILATNAWLPEIGEWLGANWLSHCITPVRGQILTTEPIHEELFPCPCYDVDGYWRQLSDNRLIVGGWLSRSIVTELSKDETPTEEIQSYLDAFVHTTLRLPKVRIERRWAGIMAFSSDSLPLVGQLPGMESCYICGGYTGHGNASALQATQIVCELVCGRRHPDANLFDPARFAHTM